MSLEQVRLRIEAAAAEVGRAPEAIKLVVVSKERGITEIRELYDQGQRHFGENRAQELAAKVDLLPEDIVWHFVGPLQTNKVRVLRPAVKLLHSFDRSDLIPAWVKGGGFPPPVLVQVRIGGEDQKHGVQPEQAVDLAAQAARAGLRVAGLMTIPPPVSRPEAARPYFQQLVDLGAELRRELPEARELSMGMTDDFEEAIRLGATIVRIGRAIFEGLPN